MPSLQPKFATTVLFAILLLSANVLASVSFPDTPRDLINKISNAGYGVETKNNAIILDRGTVYKENLVATLPIPKNNLEISCVEESVCGNGKAIELNEGGYRIREQTYVTVTACKGNGTKIALVFGCNPEKMAESCNKAGMDANPSDFSKCTTSQQNKTDNAISAISRGALFILFYLGLIAIILAALLQAKKRAEKFATAIKEGNAREAVISAIFLAFLIASAIILALTLMLISYAYPLA